MIGPAVSSTHGKIFVMITSIICQCPERGCIQMALHSSVCLNMVFVTISSNSEHRASRSSPLELHFQIPSLPMTKGNLSLTLPILALKSAISSICMRAATEYTCRLVVEGLLVFIWVCHCWSIHANTCRKVALVMILSLTVHDISVRFVTISFVIANPTPASLHFLRVASPEERVFQVVQTTRL